MRAVLAVESARWNYGINLSSGIAELHVPCWPPFVDNIAQLHMTSNMCVAKTQSCDSQAATRLNPAALSFTSSSSRSGSETGSPLRSSSPESDTLRARKDQASDEGRRVWCTRGLHTSVH